MVFIAWVDLWAAVQALTGYRRQVQIGQSDAETALLIVRELKYLGYEAKLYGVDGVLLYNIILRPRVERGGVIVEGDRCGVERIKGLVRWVAA